MYHNTECSEGLECIEGTCQEVGGEGEECALDEDWGVGFSYLVDLACQCDYVQIEGSIDDPATACTTEGTYQCGTVTVCGEQVDCTAVLGDCELGKYCNINSCEADTFANQGTVEEIFTNAEPFQILSSDIPNVANQSLQGKWISFVGLSICRQISFHGPVPEGTGEYYVRLTTTAPGITEGVTNYNVWENSECGEYYL